MPNNKEMIKRIVSIFILLICVILLIIVQIKATANAKEYFPYGVSIKSSDGLIPTFEDCDKASATDENIVVSATASRRTYVTAEYASIPQKADIVMTNHTYDDTVRVPMLYGGFFAENKIPELSKFAVISDKLAFELFQNYDVVGMLITIDKIDYTVCGVYKSNSNLLYKLSSNGIEQVFVPYNSVADYEKQIIKQMYAYDDTSIFGDGIIDKVSATLNKYIMYDEISDYRDSVKVIEQGVRIPIFILGMFAICILAFYFVKQVNKLPKQVSDLYEKKSFGNEKELRKPVVVNVSILLALLFGAIIIFTAVKFDFFLPFGFLPDDNVFDFSFYTKTIISNIQMVNASMIYDPNKIFSYLVYAFTGVNAVLISILGVLFEIFILKFILMLINGYNNE